MCLSIALRNPRGADQLLMSNSGCETSFEKELLLISFRWLVSIEFKGALANA